MNLWWVTRSYQKRKCPCHDSSSELEVEPWEQSLIRENSVEKDFGAKLLLFLLFRNAVDGSCEGLEVQCGVQAALLFKVRSPLE